MDRIELIDKRKPREKHFLQKDGTIRAEIFNEDVHYLKDGKYEEIDNTLIEKKGSIVNKSNDYRVEFKDNSHDSLMKISKNDLFIDFKIKNNKGIESKVVERKVSEEKKNVILSKLDDDVSIEYQALSNKVKETIILQSNKYSELSFELNTNLKLKSENDEIYAIDAENRTIFKIEKPFMVDANGDKNNRIYYSLAEYDDAYILKLTLDDEWLMNPERKYPIYIDPTISNISNNNITLYDTYIYPGDSQDDRDSKPYIKAGTERINGQDRVNRSLIKFDLPEIGTGSHIVNATLILVPYYEAFHEEESTLSRTVEVRRITESWNPSTATWSTMNDKYDSRVESITFFERSHIINNVVYYGTTYLDVTNLVRNWYSGVANHGLMIKSCNEEYYDDNFPMFFSTNNNVTGDPKPIISISYENQNGLEEYYDYKRISCVDSDTFINTYSGNMTSVFTVGKTLGQRFPAKATLVYNTNDAILNNSSSFGKGFKLNYEQKIIEENQDLLSFIDADGTTHYFHKGGNGLNSDRIFDNTKYYDEDGLNLIISIGQNTCTMEDLDGNQKTFEKYNNIYYLKSIKDINNNSVTVTLDNNQRITKIKDINNQEINITYNNSSVVFSCTAMTVTAYKTNNLITSIQTINGTTNITYNNLDLIEIIEDPSGTKHKYEYYQTIPHRISEITMYGINDGIGDTNTFEYYSNSTSVTNGQGLVEVITFNDRGNAIERNYQNSINDLSGAYSSTCKYGNGDKTNRLLSSNIPIKYTKNYIGNSSFEMDTNPFIIENGIVASFDTNSAHSGNRSLKLETTYNNKKASSGFALTGNKHYTFSGYFKGTGTASITLYYIQHGTQEIISSTQDIELSSDFEREDVTLYYGNDANSDLNVIIELSNGTLYVDDVQLEEGEVANYYNIMDNADFSNGLSDWTLYAGSQIDPQDPYDYMSVVTINSNNDTALKIEMDPVVPTALVKKYDINGKTGDVYTISFWYKNGSVTPYMPNVGSAVSIFYQPYNSDNGHCIVSEIIPNTGDETWHYFIHKEVAIEDFKSITINFSQTGTANDFYLTNIAFYKDVTRGEFDYDSNGNLTRISNQSNNTSQLSYNTDSQLKDIVSPSGQKVKYEYDKNKKSRLISSISAGGIVTESKYDSNGNICNIKISNKTIQNIDSSDLYTIRNNGTDKYIKAELNAVLLETNDCSNTKWKIQEQNNGKYKIIYNACPQYSVSYLNENIILSNENINNLFELEQNDNGSFHIKYIEETGEGTAIRYLKANNQLIETTLYSGESSDIEFYIEKIPDQFIETDTEYTTDGKYEEKNINSDLTEEEYEFNPNTGLLTKLINVNGIETTYSYNLMNKISGIACQNRTVSYNYNTSGLLSSVAVGNKNYNFEYDEFLNNTKVKINNNTLTQSTYSNGKLTSTTYSNGSSINYYYDTLDRLERIQKDNSENYYFKYNNNGNIAKIISNNEQIKCYYDASNRIIKYKNNDFKIDYDYDIDDRNISKNYKLENQSHTNEFEFNNDNLTKLTVDNIDFNYEYDSLGRITNKKINNNNYMNYEYLSNGKRTSNEIVKMYLNGDEYEYVYDKLGNINEVHKNNILINKYYYDDFSQLTMSEDYVEHKKYEYTYDTNSNLIEKKVINTLNNTVIEDIMLGYNNSSWEDQLSTYNGTTITYDSLGNITSYGNNELFTWNNGRELTQYSNTNQNITANYAYDMSGIRCSKNINNILTTYYTENGKVIYEKRNNDIIYYLYDIQGIAGLIYNGNIYYYEKNLLGDIIGILNSQYQKIVSYQYDDWGKILSIKDSTGQDIINPTNIGIINPFRYRGYYYDSETGLYYLNSRYYNPEWCRFISADALIASNQDFPSFNLYVYASNNPIMNTDISGYGILSSISKTVKKVVKKVSKAIGSVVNSVVNTFKKIVKVSTTQTQHVEKSSQNWGVAIYSKGTIQSATIETNRKENSIIEANHEIGGGDSIGFNNQLFATSIAVDTTGVDFSVKGNTGFIANQEIMFGIYGGDVYIQQNSMAEGSGVSTGTYKRLSVNGIVAVIVVSVATVVLCNLSTTAGKGVAAPIFAPAVSLA